MKVKMLSLVLSLGFFVGACGSSGENSPAKANQQTLVDSDILQFPSSSDPRAIDVSNISAGVYQLASVRSYVTDSSQVAVLYSLALNKKGELSESKDAFTVKSRAPNGLAALAVTESVGLGLKVADGQLQFIQPKKILFNLNQSGSAVWSFSDEIVDLSILFSVFSGRVGAVYKLESIEGIIIKRDQGISIFTRFVQADGVVHVGEQLYVRSADITPVSGTQPATIPNPIPVSSPGDSAIEPVIARMQIYTNFIQCFSDEHEIYASVEKLAYVFSQESQNISWGYRSKGSSENFTRPLQWMPGFTTTGKKTDSGLLRQLFSWTGDLNSQLSIDLVDSSAPDRKFSNGFVIISGKEEKLNSCNFLQNDVYPGKF